MRGKEMVGRRRAGNGREYDFDDGIWAVMIAISGLANDGVPLYMCIV